ncbi:DUF167 domain-containing protein [Quadrisphaera sp. INWT6]|uniref:DUF167 domain-containing protein n=1 Tax=Quadrisphaera sp. INWT6 TaxID=2596917 RepID=UPI0018924FA2|nr:DUF167 domain-containing protein [Quadrisphaera sp. INWT6]MBF5082073.1 DUF167 domain-containing protein [Quadrisphaera sp. INWT6]
MRVVVRVRPGSRRGPLVETDDDGVLVVHVRERAVDGAANTGLVRALAEHFGVAPSRVAVVRGHTSRTKQVDVDV